MSAMQGLYNESGLARLDAACSQALRVSLAKAAAVPPAAVSRRWSRRDGERLEMHLATSRFRGDVEAGVPDGTGLDR